MLPRGGSMRSLLRARRLVGAPHAARLFATGMSGISSAQVAPDATACGSPAIRRLCGAVFICALRSKVDTPPYCAVLPL